MSLRSSSISTESATHWLRSSAPTLIVAGCGVSMGAPTFAPGVRTFLDATTASLEANAGYSPQDKGYRLRLFPEACYGAIGEAFETNSHLRMWSCLDPTAARDVGAHASIGHRVLVELSARNAWPIITTNFDCLFEEAADDLGIATTVRIPTTSERLQLRRPAPQTTVIVKLHGTANDYASIKSTAADLSRCAQVLERVDLSPTPQRALVVGYGGRDFDLFPWLAERFGDRDVLWIDSTFPDDHRANAFTRVRKWLGEWNELAGQVIEDRPVAPAIGTKTAWEGKAREAVVQHVGRLLAAGDGGAIAAMVGVLVSTGAHVDAAELGRRADEVHKTGARIQTLLWTAHANASVDRFSTALRAARRARKLAWQDGQRYAAGRAAIAISYSRVANYWLGVVPGQARRGLFRLRSYLALLSVLWVTAAYAPLALVTIPPLRRVTAQPGTARYRFATEYLEHLVRLLALLESLRRLPAFSLLLDRAWWLLQRVCAQVGYPWGVLNASKYISRQHGNFSTPGGALTRSDSIGDLVGQVITRRDASTWLLAHPPMDATDEDRRQHRAEAMYLLDDALERAEQLECPSLILKIAALQSSVDGRTLSRARVHELISATECAALARDEYRVVALLCGDV